MPAYLTDITARIRYETQEPSGGDKWADADLLEYINQAVGYISKYVPYETSSDTFFLGGTRLVDISSLNAYDVLRVEYETVDTSGNPKVPKSYRNFEMVGRNQLEVKLNNTPSGEVLLASAVATSTSAGNIVDSGNHFDTTMENCKITNDTDGTWTYVTTYSSASTMAVKDDIFISGDTYSIYERVPVRIWYTTKHTYSETVRTFPAWVEDFVLEGAICYAMSAYSIGLWNQLTLGDQVVNNGLIIARDRQSKWERAIRGLQLSVSTEEQPR
jgi:hypothetical protein